MHEAVQVKEIKKTAGSAKKSHETHCQPLLFTYANDYFKKFNIISRVLVYQRPNPSIQIFNIIP